MEKNDYYKKMFLIAAIWNWIVGVIFILVSLIAPDVASAFGIAIPPSFMWFHLAFALGLLFGCFFFATYMNLEKFHDVAIFYVGEKFIFFFIMLIYLIIGDINFLGFSLTIIDLVFGCLFLEFWLRFEA